MDQNRIFIQNSNLKDRIRVLKDNLKRHLSAEYIYLSEAKENLESEVAQLRVEKEQKDKTLFQNQEKSDKRKYFSPHNISEISHEEYDEKQKQLASDIRRREAEIDNLSHKMEEIKSFLNDIEDILGSELDNVFQEYTKEKDIQKRMQ